MCLRLAKKKPQKLRVPATHASPLIAQGVFGFAQIRPEHTLSPIQLNCSRTRGALARVCLDGLFRRDGEFLSQPRPPPPLPCVAKSPSVHRG